MEKEHIHKMIYDNLLRSIPKEQIDLLLNHKNVKTGKTLISEILSAVSENPSDFDIRKLTGMFLAMHLEIPKPKEKHSNVVDLYTALKITNILENDDAYVYLRRPGEILLTEFKLETVRNIKNRYDMRSTFVTEIIPCPYATCDSGKPNLFTIRNTSRHKN